ncbi:predicted protein [Nematostella vectensis]|uniref:Decaprenyl-diphosphate synthase subunit 1 n=1 Tax=Nematostella vectensis TaxID=45351 RepID=A7RHN1_NEMVE|nr:predicted protein [Nematostella vectensis]|eukprot:XP_001640946.1 predicted protein [Nematostella vectensis]
MAARFFTRLKSLAPQPKYCQKVRSTYITVPTKSSCDSRITPISCACGHLRYFSAGKRVFPSRSASRRCVVEKRGCIRPVRCCTYGANSDRNNRCYSTSIGSKESYDAEANVKLRLSGLCGRIKHELNTSVETLQRVSHYYFDGKGKYIRPRIVLLMAAATNYHSHRSRVILHDQETAAMISEMIHTASLIHDDVIDRADTRRGKVAINLMYGDKNCILAGDYILSRVSLAIARFGNVEAVKLLAEIVDELVRGEFMQLGSKENPDERFTHYLKKTYKKTASLIACCCKTAVLLGDSPPDIQDIAFQYGRNVGIAFQLVDDVLDFVSSKQEMGKATAADLKLGLATAPVLFACEKFPDLNSLVMRRFKEPGDVEQAFDAVYQSDGISRTYDLANQYAKEALRQVNKLDSSPERQAIINITHKILNRRN